MAYIEPNSEIWLLKGITWSNNYENTPYFYSKGQQYADMKRKVFRVYSQQSYQRHSKNSLRILGKAEDLFECNYLMFQNTSYGNKWFYAFVTNCEYINDNTTEITYEIDEIQTWFWDLELGQCFVEREIAESDGLFENLVPEKLETGEYILGANNRYNMNDHTYYLIQATTDSEGNPNVGEVNGIACPIYYMKLPTSASKQALQALIEPYYTSPNNPENIINIQLVPKNIAQAAVPEPGQMGGLTEDEMVLPMPYALDGYTPKNKKLFIYPYSMLYATNNVGQGVEYHWENFKLDEYGEAHFYILGCALGNPTITAFPEWYRGRDIDYDSGLSMTNFPPVPWVCDTYKAYLAQNKASITTSILTSTVGSLVGIASGVNGAILGQAINNNIPNSNPVGQLTSEGNRNYGIINTAGSAIRGGSSIAETLAQLEDRKAMPKTISTMIQNDVLMLLAERLQFDFYAVTIKKEMAKIIDDYFSLYGYAQHKVKIPNIKSRPQWNYTQTKGCILLGSCPASSKTFISKCFDNGIRFWKNQDEIGNYSLNNSV